MAQCPLATANDTSASSNGVSTNCTTEAPPLAPPHGIPLQSTYTSMNSTPEQSLLATAGNGTLCQSSLALADVTTAQSVLTVMGCNSEVSPLATVKPVLSTAASATCASGQSHIALSCTSEVSPLAMVNPVQSTVAPMTCPPEVSPLAPASSSMVQPQTEFIILDQNGQTLQCERMVIVTGQSEGREVFVIPSNQLSGSQLLLPRSQLVDINPAVSGVEKESSLHTITVTAFSDDISQPPVAAPDKTLSENVITSLSSRGQDVSSLKPLPANTPSWAQRLRNAEKIGDSYRGYCSTEAELETILLLHKQQTGCVFGTRQSPSLAKPATRLMWKSQYVPYDGIPFVNAGSRAIVMECQYGPRRKGLQPKKSNGLLQSDYKATCPARIYIKKVRKFPEYRVPTEPTADRKTVRQEQEKAFCSLRTKLLDTGGVLRYYMQLPTEKAHLYHDTDAPIPPPPPDLLPPAQEQPQEEEEEEKEEEEGGIEDGAEEGGIEDGLVPSRLHPRVAEKIGELVAQGHHQVYSVRKQLRHFVEREMFKSDGVPERHNQCYFPTVNDIKNHIHEAQKALWGGLCGDPLTETVTLTLTPASAEVRGVLEGSEALSPEAVQLFSSLSSLQPKIFAQLQGIQLQSVTTLCSVDESLSQPPAPNLSTTYNPSSTTQCLPPDLPDPLPPLSPHPVPSLSPPHPLLFVAHVGQLEFNPSPSHSLLPAAHPSPSLPSSLSLHPSSSPSLHPSPSLSPPQSLVVSPTSFLQTSSPLGETLGLAGPQAVLGVGQMVSVSALGDGGTHQIILEDGQTIPVQIVNTGNIALTGPNVIQVGVKEEEQGEAEEMKQEEEGDSREPPSRTQHGTQPESL